MLTTENCSEKMTNLSGGLTGKTTLKDSGVDPFVDYFLLQYQQ
jgi:hypothetical protein